MCCAMEIKTNGKKNFFIQCGKSLSFQLHIDFRLGKDSNINFNCFKLLLDLDLSIAYTKRLASHRQSIQLVDELLEA